MPTKRIARHKTAISRTDLSRPIRLALEDGFIQPGTTVFDYGCGKGDDIKRLRKLEVAADGWDPAHKSSAKPHRSKLVNLGYVVNVIEDPLERVQALKKAWDLAERHLVVSARLNADIRKLKADEYKDGCVTKSGTFQKFYDQAEFRSWVDDTLNVQSVPAAPGVFYVFRDDEERQSYLATKYRRRSATPRLRKSDILFEEHKPLFEALMAFLTERGRLPGPLELEQEQELIEVAGSLKRAFLVIMRVTGTEDWERIAEERAQDLLVHLALARFDRRPKFGKLAKDLRLDVKAFFSSYKRACELADVLLFSAGNLENIEQAARESSIGKLTGSAIYVHKAGLDELPPVLRVYEGCARAYIGKVEAANIVKLHRRKPQISYLSYPTFDKDPHPILERSLVVPLQSFRLRVRDYSDSKNPPLLHRKEEFVPQDYPGRKKFARLTMQEEKWGLLKETTHIGTVDRWEGTLAKFGVQLRGHKLTKCRG